MPGGYARIVRSVKPADRRAYVPEWGMILGNDGVRGSGALSYELVCATAGRIHVVAYRLTDDRGVANGKRARIITERLRLGGSAVRRVVRHCEKARRENKRSTRPTPPSPWRLVGHIRRSRIGVQRPAHAPRGPAGAAVHPRDRIRDAWFVILAVLALILSVISRRWIAMLMALACIGLQCGGSGRSSARPRSCRRPSTRPWHRPGRTPAT